MKKLKVLNHINIRDYITKTIAKKVNVKYTNNR